MLEKQKESLFNQLIKNKKYLQHKKIAETTRKIESLKVCDEKAIETIKKLLRDTSLEYVEMKEKLAKYEKHLV